MCPYGAPDDSNILSPEGLQRVDDLAELAARMGSIVNYSRSGNIWLLEDFEGDISKWRTQTGPAAGEVVVCDERVYSGNISLKMETGVGVDPYAYLAKWMPVPPISRIGLATTFSFADDIEYLHWEVNFTEGLLAYHFRVQYWPVAGRLTFNDPAWGFIEFALPGPMDTTQPTFHSGKLVVDMLTKEYIGFWFDNTGYDLTGKVGPTTAFAFAPISEFVLYAEAVNPGPAFCYLDNVILTYNEF